VASSCKWWWSWLSCMCWSLTHLSVEISMLVRIPNVRMKFGKQQEKMRGSWLRSQTPWIVLDGTSAKQSAHSRAERMREAQEKRREIKDRGHAARARTPVRWCARLLALWVLWLIESGSTGPIEYAIHDTLLKNTV
jgi:hypothetical protein